MEVLFTDTGDRAVNISETHQTEDNVQADLVLHSLLNKSICANSRIRCKAYMYLIVSQTTNFRL